MSDGPFIVHHPNTGVSFELNDVAFFVREYQPQGFVIDAHPPTGYAVPSVSKAKATKGDVEKALAALPTEPVADVTAGGGKL
jgi:hypothetical protein